MKKKKKKKKEEKEEKEEKEKERTGAEVSLLHVAKINHLAI